MALLAQAYQIKQKVLQRKTVLSLCDKRALVKTCDNQQHPRYQPQPQHCIQTGDKSQ